MLLSIRKVAIPHPRPIFYSSSVRNRHRGQYPSPVAAAACALANSRMAFSTAVSTTSHVRALRLAVSVVLTCLFTVLPRLCRGFGRALRRRGFSRRLAAAAAACALANIRMALATAVITTPHIRALRLAVSVVFTCLFAVLPAGATVATAATAAAAAAASARCLCSAATQARAHVSRSHARGWRMFHPSSAKRSLHGHHSHGRHAGGQACKDTRRGAREHVAQHMAAACCSWQSPAALTSAQLLRFPPVDELTCAAVASEHAPPLPLPLEPLLLLPPLLPLPLPLLVGVKVGWLVGVLVGDAVHIPHVFSHSATAK